MERQRLVDEEVDSCSTSIARIYEKLEQLKKPVIKLGSDSRLLKPELRKIIQKTRELKNLISLLNLPEIYDHTTSSIGKGCWLARRTNCRKCKRCKNNPEENPHGPYLFKITKVNGKVKWKSWGPVEKAVLKILESEEDSCNTSIARVEKLKRNEENVKV